MRLKAVRSTLTQLAPTLGTLPMPERTVDQRRSDFAPWRRLYKTARWRDLRLRSIDLLDAQLATAPITTDGGASPVPPEPAEPPAGR